MASNVRELRVSGNSDPVKVGSAIAHAIYEGCIPHVRCMGVPAVNQAVKSVINARGYAAQRGHNLYTIPAFDTIVNEQEEVSVVVLKVVDLSSPADIAREPELA